MASNQTFGLTPLGFIPMQQQDVIADLEASAQQQFSPNVNLGASSLFGQFIGLMSAPLAQLWQLGEAIYVSQYPNGAEGTSVDNVLALTNLKRPKAVATTTNPDPDLQTNGITLYGLLLFGTPGRVIPVGSIIQTTATPPLSVTLNAAVTIAASVNAVQSLFFGNVPTQGSMALSLEDPAGNTLDLPTWGFGVLANQTQLVIGTTPGATSHFGLTLTQAGAALTTGNISTNSAYPTSAAIQSAITALAGYSGVTVSGSAGTYLITWGAIANPTTAVANNTTGSTITATGSVQAGINNAVDSEVSPENYPFTDVTVTGNFSTGLVFSFGAGTAIGSNPVSSAQPQATMLIVTNSLQNGSTVTNINVSQTAIGQQAQGVGAATCISNSATYANFIAAGTLSVIGSPVSGWSGVTNQLDCITGSNVFDDTQALVYRSAELSSNANGTIQAIVEKVKKVNGVTAVIGFQNLSGAALQVLTFTGALTTGAYTISINGQTTGSLVYSSSASAVQTALQALTGYSAVLVTGSSVYGFTINFNGSYGGQAQPLATLTNNTTGVTGAIAFGRPPNSFEIVVQGGANNDIASAIYGAQTDGIGSYGSTNVTIQDAFNNPVIISFSRPSQVTFYAAIVLITDTYLIPGNSGSGLNPKSLWNAQSTQTIQQDIIAIGNAVATGGLVIGFGTGGLIGAFNAVPGIVSYTFYFGTSTSPASNANIQLLSEQQALWESYNVGISWT